MCVPEGTGKMPKELHQLSRRPGTAFRISVEFGHPKAEDTPPMSPVPLPPRIPGGVARACFQELVRILPGWLWRGGIDPIIAHAGQHYSVDLVLSACADLKEALPRGCSEVLGLPRYSSYSLGSIAAKQLVDLARRQPFSPTQDQEQVTPRRATAWRRRWVAAHQPTEDAPV
jgi:hypothetical protein